MKLSIITINFNNLEGLQKTIDSVIFQTFRDFEWIVIDGGSTDGSKELIEHYADHFTYWVSEPDKGVYNAMNKGIKAANGEYCLFLNSGDYLSKDTSLKDVFFFETDASLIMGKVLYCVSEQNQIVIGFDNLDFSLFQLFQCSVPHQACFIKRDLLIKYGLYDESYRIVSDLKVFHNCVVSDSCDVVCVNQVVSIVDGHGISSDLEKNDAEMNRLICELYSPKLLKDYCDWRRLKKENVNYKNREQYYHNAIALYDFVKKHPALRKLHTFFYKIALKLMS